MDCIPGNEWNRALESLSNIVYREGITREVDALSSYEETANALQHEFFRAWKLFFPGKPGTDYETIEQASPEEQARIKADASRTQRRPIFGLEKEEQEVVKALAESGNRMTQTQIFAETSVSEKTIGKVLRRLHNKGLVDYPPNTRKGALITELGLEAADSL